MDSRYNGAHIDFKNDILIPSNNQNKRTISAKKFIFLWKKFFFTLTVFSF